MKGYGLTVFQGTAPETFAVESVGVMKNSFPKQDLVIIFMDDPKLIESNIVAGMSGSPIYFDGRLLGALAYGPVFSKKPIAYVTPIQNMLEEIDRPAEPERPWQSLASRPRASTRSAAFIPVESPLSLSGFSPARIRMIEDLLAPYGLIPVASGSSAEDKSGPATNFAPGSAIGIQLMSGDMSMTAIGTVTYVDPKGRVLAFGHPFFNIGQTAMPATTARVHGFMPSTYISYKLASPVRTLGSMVQDRQPAILIDPKRTAPMVPVVINVENASTGRKETFRYHVIREQMLTPILTYVGLSEALDVAEAGSMKNRAFDIESRVRLKGRPAAVELTDVTPNPGKTFFDIMSLLENNIEEAVPEAFDFDVKVTNSSRMAWITDVRTSDRKFQPGDRVPITVRLRNQRGDEFEESAGFTLPAGLEARSVILEIRGGFGFSQPEPPPETLEQLVALMQKRPKGSDLIVRLMQAPPSYARNGHVLRDLPMFFQKILQGGVEGIPQAVIQPPYEQFSTDFLLLGSQRVQIEIIPEGRPR